MSEHSLGTGLAVLALFLYASSTLLTRSASARVDSNLGFLVAVGVNVLLCSVAVSVQSVLRSEPTVLHARGFLMFMLGGVFTTYLGRWFFFESVVRMGAARASTFGTVNPVFTALIGWLLLGDRLSLDAVVAMMLVISGLILVTGRGSSSTAGLAVAPSYSRGKLLILGLASSLAYAVGNIVRADGIRNWNEPLIGALTGAVVGLGMQLLINRGDTQALGRLREADRRGVWLFVAVGSTNIAAQVLSIWAMRYLPAAEVALIVTATPLLVLPAGFFWMRKSEAITRGAATGLVLSVCGVGYLVARPLI